MTRKTIQVPEELHDKLKLKSVQSRMSIPKIIENLMITTEMEEEEEEKSSSAAVVAAAAKSEDCEDKKKDNDELSATDGKEEGDDKAMTFTIPQEFWRQLTEDATPEELIQMGYRIESYKDGKAATFTIGDKDTISTFVLPAKEGPYLTPEQFDRTKKILEDYRRRGIDPEREYAKERLIRWRTFIRAKTRAIDFIEEIEQALGKRPLPEHYSSKVYRDIQALESAIINGDYATLKAKILEADPNWKEWMPPVGIKIEKEWLDRVHAWRDKKTANLNDDYGYDDNNVAAASIEDFAARGYRVDNSSP